MGKTTKRKSKSKSAYPKSKTGTGTRTRTRKSKRSLKSKKSKKKSKRKSKRQSKLKIMKGGGMIDMPEELKEEISKKIETIYKDKLLDAHDFIIEILNSNLHFLKIEENVKTADDFFKLKIQTLIFGDNMKLANIPLQSDKINYDCFDKLIIAFTESYTFYINATKLNPDPNTNIIHNYKAVNYVLETLAEKILGSNSKNWCDGWTLENLFNTKIIDIVNNSLKFITNKQKPTSSIGDDNTPIPLPNNQNIRKKKTESVSLSLSNLSTTTIE